MLIMKTFANKKKADKGFYFFTKKGGKDDTNL